MTIRLVHTVFDYNTITILTTDVEFVSNMNNNQKLYSAADIQSFSILVWKLVLNRVCKNVIKMGQPNNTI